MEPNDNNDDERVWIALNPGPFRKLIQQCQDRSADILIFSVHMSIQTGRAACLFAEISPEGDVRPIQDLVDDQEAVIKWIASLLARSKNTAGSEDDDSLPLPISTLH